MPDFFNTNQAAAFLDVSRNTFQEWRRRGYVPAGRRWTEEQLKAVNPPPKKGTPRKKQSPGGKPDGNAEPDRAGDADPSPPGASPAEPARPLSDVDPGDPYKLNLPRPPVTKKAEPAQKGGSNAAKPPEKGDAAPGSTAPNGVDPGQGETKQGWWGGW